MFHLKLKDTLKHSIATVTSHMDSFVYNPGRDYSRIRKLSPDHVISFLISQGASSTKCEFLDFFQMSEDHLLEWRTIYKNVLLGLEIRRELTAEKLAYVNQLLSDYGLDKFRSAHPSELSGGMRQRAALIRTLALKPELLLLDEPFSALDSQTRLSVSDDIGKILRQEKKTAILVTHDISEAISMADRVIILSPRPAIIRKIVPVCFDLENRTPMASRNAPEFKSYFNLIWKELNHDV